MKKKSFTKFLKAILDNYNSEKVLEVLKASGFFISMDENFAIDQKQKESVDEFVKNNLKEKNIIKYEKLV